MKYGRKRNSIVQKAKKRQESTYESINVSVFEEKLSIPGLEDNMVTI